MSVCQRFSSDPVHPGGGECHGGCHGDLRKTVRVGGGWASLLPPCSWLHCAAAVSAGMAPLTICSLIANIRVHFLRHWSGTERWRAELWAFLPLCLSRSCSTLPGDGGRIHKHTRTHTYTHKRDRRPLTHPAYLYCPAVSNSPSISKHTCSTMNGCIFIKLPLSHIIHRSCTYVLSTSLIQSLSSLNLMSKWFTSFMMLTTFSVFLKKSYVFLFFFGAAGIFLENMTPCRKLTATTNR